MWNLKKVEFIETENRMMIIRSRGEGYWGDVS
jgi:hypothetical protein